MNNDHVVIVGAKRTPIGAFRGALSGVSATALGSFAIKAAIEQSSIDSKAVDEALMGCCLFGNLGQAPARQAVIGAGLAETTPATTVSKMCGSGMKAAMIAHDQLLAKNCTVAVAGGMESMSNSPHLLVNHRQGRRLGHDTVLDHMYRDGLEDAYEGKLMGYYADLIAEQMGFSREDQDRYAAESVQQAQLAIDKSLFNDEIIAIDIPTRRDQLQQVSMDETPGRCDPNRLALLKPVFRHDGTVTAGNASSISDGAAALVMMLESEAMKRGLKPLARIKALATNALKPGDFPLAPIGAIERVLDKASWTKDQVDLFEINEAFAVVALIAMRQLNLPRDKINVHGGACALGHPIGATGARIIVTLLYALRKRNLKRGVATLCIGGGEATAMAIEV